MLTQSSILQNRYRIVRKLGQGGMGAVYEAIDQRVSCVVSLKETLVGPNSEAREAFRREAALLANLRHPALPKVMDHFSEADGEFLVMEYIAGHDLAELLAERGRPFSQAEVLRWADELLKLLDYLHTRQPPVIHRDIKPANLKVTAEGEIFLLDFGLAKGAVGQMATMQTDQSVRGYTPIYAPLEQIHERGTDPRSDLYALGATLYCLLTGQPPVSAPVRFEAIENGRPDPLTPINELNPEVSALLAAVVQRAMALSRRNRPSSAAEMRNSLEHARQSVLDTVRVNAERALAETQSDAVQDPDKPIVADSNVQFTVYSPGTIKPEKDYTLLVFAHLSKRRDDAPDDDPDPIREMKDQAARILGKQAPDYADTRQSSNYAVPRGGEITFVPVVPGITFTPGSRSFNWRKSVHREEFDLCASSDFDGQTVSGRLTVFLGCLIIAEVPLTISIDRRAESVAEQISLDSPQSARRVRQVFASYSHLDEQVVAELAHVAPLFGARFLMDRTHLEPGEDRRAGLQRLIRSADAFQLFWSTNSMRSPDTVEEIKYATSLGRPGFILPTYWEEPLPRSRAEGLPPPEIDQLHFYRIYPGAISRATFVADQPAVAGATPETRSATIPAPASPRPGPYASPAKFVEPAQSFGDAPSYHVQMLTQAPAVQRKRRLMMPIFAGAAMVLFVVIMAPLFILMKWDAPSNTSLPIAANPSQNSNTTANSNVSANVGITPPSQLSIIPKRVVPPADLVAFVSSSPAYQEPVQVQEVDLNGDGTPELLVQYESCNSGRCIIHLFERTENGFKEISGGLLATTFASIDDAKGSFVAGPESSNGYLDLRYRFKNERASQRFRFDGQSYQARR